MRGRWIRFREHTRDQVWRMRSKDPTANIPVVEVIAVPTGLLQGRCRWAHLLLWSRVEIELRCPSRGRMRRGGEGSLCWWRWWWWWCRLQTLQTQCRALRFGEQRGRRRLHGHPPCLQTRELGQHLIQERVESIKLLRDVVHGGSHLGLKLGGLPRLHLGVGGRGVDAGIGRSPAEQT